MKQIITLLLSAVFSVSGFAKDLHFIYIRFDMSMDTELLKAQIDKLKNSIGDGDFILYYSNENTTMDHQSWDRDKLFLLISSLNSSAAISIPDEIEDISVPLENRLQQEPYGAIIFDCFVGNSFFDNNFQDMLFARMLLVNSLNKSKYHLMLHYYPCGAYYNEKQIQFNSEYSLNINTKIISSL